MKRVLQFGAVVVAVGGLVSGFAAGDEPLRARWTRTPTSAETAACQPLVTEIPDGSALLVCRVGDAGRLEECSVETGTDPLLTEWGLCLSSHFVAEPAQIGQTISLPLQWRRPA